MRAPEFKISTVKDPCRHDRYEFRRRNLRSGQVQHGYQCIECGAWDRLTKAEAGPVLYAPPYNETLGQAYWGERNKRDHLAEFADRRAVYSQYINSPEWRARRAMRLQMDGHICQAQIRCHGAHATEVHHITYSHFGYEPMFDLASVCKACHNVLTDLDHGVDPDDEQAERDW